MKFEGFSRKQLETLTWWSDASPHRELDAIICDGAVRSGKTLCMGLSFICWASRRFQGEKFGICGKSIPALRRNVVSVLLPVLRDLGFSCRDSLSKNVLTIGIGGRLNEFYLFGGHDESSQDRIQGVTFAGVLLDEVALMPRSFVEQACARCSVPGSKMWFSCNPEGPQHWFYREWIRNAAARGALYLHFTMEDNPALSRKIINRYKKLYSGVFYRRFVLGEWVAAKGLVYDFFDESYVREAPEEPCESYYISCDYGTANPSSFGLWGRKEGVWYRIREFYYASRETGRQLTDAEYVEELRKLAGGRPISGVVADPSAASFILALRQAGFPVFRADNDVISGIRTTAGLLKSGGIVICRDCTAAIREFSQYCWANPEKGSDLPKKENDHAMDDIRYFAATVAARREAGFAVGTAERKTEERRERIWAF